MILPLFVPPDNCLKLNWSLPWLFSFAHLRGSWWWTVLQPISRGWSRCFCLMFSHLWVAMSFSGQQQQTCEVWWKVYRSSLCGGSVVLCKYLRFILAFVNDLINCVILPNLSVFLLCLQVIVTFTYYPKTEPVFLPLRFLFMLGSQTWNKPS